MTVHARRNYHDIGTSDLETEVFDSTSFDFFRVSLDLPPCYPAALNQPLHASFMSSYNDNSQRFCQWFRFLRPDISHGGDSVICKRLLKL